MFHLSLAAARINARMTQKEVAEKMGVHTNTIINWENGSRLAPAEQILRLSELYDVPIEFLLTARNEKDGTLKEYTKIVVETDEENPVTVATITEKKTEVAQGYRVRLTPGYD